MTKIITPTALGLVGPNGQPLNGHTAAEPNPEDLLPAIAAFLDQQGIEVLPSTLTMTHPVLGQHRVKVLAFPAPSCVQLMNVLKAGGETLQTVHTAFKASQAKCAELAKVSEKRRDMVSEHITHTKNVRNKAQQRIAALEQALEHVIDTAGLTEAGVLDDSRRALEAANEVLKTKVKL